MRNTGVLLHISSLPTKFGIGDFGPSALAFAKYLISKGHKMWQILPINHCGYGNSPYNPLSAFAFNPYLISPELLYQQGLINQQSLQEAMLPSGDTVYYELVYKTKDVLLTQASANWIIQNDVQAYIEENAYQLKPYLAFMALYKIYGDSAWFNWQPEHRHFSEELFNNLEKQFRPYIYHQAACQAIAKEQINLLKSQLKQLGLTLVGDMPLYLSYESAEVWAHPEYFDLDANGQRLHLAGVPPDAFSANGQMWGNPIYNWSAMQADEFQLLQSVLTRHLAIWIS
jgi:4-alpha-glucanotransferase